MSGTAYFSHDANARNDSKVLRLRMKHGAAGYGVYFMLLERLRDEQDYVSVKDYNMIAFDLRVDAGLIKSVVEDFGLFAFTEGGECFYSESFNRRMSIKDEVKNVRSEAGRRGAEKRWGSKKNAVEIAENGKTMANAMANDSKTMANAIKNYGKESKVKKEKKKESVYKEKAADAAFSPPTHTQVFDFCKNEGLHIDIEAFMQYNAARGWMIGSSPMQDWKAAVKKWAHNGRDKPPNPQVRIPTAEEVAAREEAERRRKEEERSKCISWDEYKRRRDAKDTT